MSIDDIYKLCLFAIKKNNNGDLKPVDFNRLINAAQKQWLAYMLGNIQTYQPGRPIASHELGNNRTLRQRITPVIYGYILDVNATTGMSPYPGDFLQVDSMYSIYGVKRVRFSEQNQLDSFYNSVIDPIASNPIYLVKDTGFQFYPTSQWQARLSYVREPPRVEWAYTEDVHGRPVYDPVHSIDPVFDDLTVLEIIVRVLALVGLNLQVAAVIGYSNEIKSNGQ